MNSSETLNQIKTVINELNSVGVCVDCEKPYIKQGKGNKYFVESFQGDLADVFHQNDYEYIYSQSKNNRFFSLLLIDGAILQFFYVFSKNDILKHRLAYLPDPNILSYEDWRDEYNTSELYLETTHDKTCIVPLRIDFAPEDHRERVHPTSHAHLGFIESCRIPVSRPITPLGFTKFIISSFYSSIFERLYTENEIWSRGNCSDFSETITLNEKKTIHFNI